MASASTSSDAKPVTPINVLSPAKYRKSLPKRSSFQTDNHQSPPDRSRVFWTPSQDSVLLNLMIEQVHRGGKVGNSFKKEAWKHMIARFNSKFGLNYDVQQIKYRLKYYTNQYRVVRALLSRGFGWNSASRTVVADNSAWESYLGENPDAARIRDKQWPYYEDWCRIFEPCRVGEMAEFSSPNLELDDGVMADDTDIGEDAGLTSPPVRSPTLAEEFEASHSQDPLDGTGQTNEQNDFHISKPFTCRRPAKAQRSKEGVDIHNALNSIADAVRFKAAQSAEPRQDKWPVEKCIEELKTIEGLEEELFLKALLVFRDEYNRRVFLSLKGDLRTRWLKLICH